MAASTGGVFLPNENITLGKNLTVEGNVAVTGDLTVTGTIADTGSSFASPTITGTVAGGATYSSPVLVTPTLGVATATSINGNILTTGSSTYTGTAAQTYTFPTTSATIARTDAANTFTGVQTMTSAALTTPTITGGTITSAIDADFKVLAANATYTSTVTPATLTGFSWTVVAGTYVFEVNLPATMTTNGGLNVNFLLTTAVLTSIQYQSYAATASDNTTAVSTNGTTTTSGTLVFTNKTAAYTHVNIKGSMVVGTGGTFAWQGSQETSAGGGDATIVAIGSYARLTRVA